MRARAGGWRACGCARRKRGAGDASQYLALPALEQPWAHEALAPLFDPAWRAALRERLGRALPALLRPPPAPQVHALLAAERTAGGAAGAAGGAGDAAVRRAAAEAVGVATTALAQL